MPSSVICTKLFLQFFLYSRVNKKEWIKLKLKLSTLDNKYKSDKIFWNIVFTMQLTVFRETIKTSAKMGCEYLTEINDGWITK